MKKELKQAIQRSEVVDNYLDSQQYPFGADKYQWHKAIKGLTDKEIDFSTFNKVWQHRTIENKEQLVTFIAELI